MTTELDGVTVTVKQQERLRAVGEPGADQRADAVDDAVGPVEVKVTANGRRAMR